ncbi:TIGR03936 family radical SAM-associated protein [Desulfofundulus salinus]|uniref:TIGR03936 family radical SAM-associated protein n=1 Tax=Desulfofundulus salinus TaxID=2419843 RepID=UPI0014037A38|nr:TIGR03936 family radical SAM-associated protein [Desulfofundulus salinum]
MPRYRIEFRKEGPARFISHLDLVRTLERAMRRAGLPLAFSQGFNPHPRFSLGAPLPVGVKGEKEYLDLELVAALPVDEMLKRLSDQLPRGLKMTRVWRIPGDAPALMATLEKATYRVDVSLAREITQEDLQRSIDGLLETPEVIITRRAGENREKVLDIRPGIYALSGRLEDGRIRLEMSLAVGNRGTVRPEEVVLVLAERFGLPVKDEQPDVIRTGLYPAEPEKFYGG